MARRTSAVKVARAVVVPVDAEIAAASNGGRLA
jgi:hypothetical protein